MPSHVGTGPVRRVARGSSPGRIISGKKVVARCFLIQKLRPTVYAAGSDIRTYWSR